MSGSPAFENSAWLRSTAVFAKLPEVMRKLRTHEKEIAELKNALKAKDAK